MPKIGSIEIADDSIRRLGYHKVTDETLPKHAEVRRHMMWLDSWLDSWIIENIPNGREQSLARTAIREAAMWCNAGIACNLAPAVSDPGTFDEE